MKCRWTQSSRCAGDDAWRRRSIQALVVEEGAPHRQAQDLAAPAASLTYWDSAAQRQVEAPPSGGEWLGARFGRRPVAAAGGGGGGYPPTTPSLGGLPHLEGGGTPPPTPNPPSLEGGVWGVKFVHILGTPPKSQVRFGQKSKKNALFSMLLRSKTLENWSGTRFTFEPPPPAQKGVFRGKKTC